MAQEELDDKVAELTRRLGQTSVSFAQTLTNHIRSGHRWPSHILALFLDDEGISFGTVGDSCTNPQCLMVLLEGVMRRLSEEAGIPMPNLQGPEEHLHAPTQH